MKTSTRLVVASIVVLFLTAAGGGVWFGWFQTYHFAVVQDGVLYRDGNRDLREFTHAVARAHVKTVVSLIDDRELADPAKPQFKAEADWCAANGIRQIRIPVKLGGWPTTDDIRKFLAVTSDPAAQPVLVHCAQGVRRTGMFVAAYQLSVQRDNPVTAKNLIPAFGHATRDTDDVRTFIDLYRPDTRTVQCTPADGSAD